ncbi:hypothetical protein [Leifsonia aquatica]|uniref:hypothetical protein n=1 Tax=Leifsonia aquatica TaxID=144185 RepID=UPI00046A52BF|nr:hypothetical protein [Leifsonia aquatica]
MPTNETPPLVDITGTTVHDLGEDGDSFIVEGTQDVHIALAAVDAHALISYGARSDEFEDVHRLLPVARTTVGTWWWREHCSHDSELVSVGVDLPPALFRGVRVDL